MSLAPLGDGYSLPYHEAIDPETNQLQRDIDMMKPVGDAYAKYSPAADETGYADFIQAQSALQKLNAHPTTDKDYSKANATSSDWFSGRSDSIDAINRQTHWEDQLKEHLANISALGAHGKISAAMWGQAQELGSQYKSRLEQDFKNALAGDPPSGPTQRTQMAYDRDSAGGVLEDGLKRGNLPDTIPLSETSSFLDQIKTFDSDVHSHLDAYRTGNEAAKDQLSADATKVSTLIDTIDRQIDACGGKIDALPDSDSLKSDYSQQSKQLTDHDHGVDVLFADREKLDAILHHR